jgi:hypothetical protein
MQVMENGNVFMGWSERALHSEHSPDGTLLMEAIFVPEWMGTYRSYKFPYVGRPKTKPDVKSVAYMQDENREYNPLTKVYVSWNGDTEVRSWKMRGSDSDNDKDSLPEVGSADRKGFETSFEYQGYYKWISLEGLDKDGNVLTDTGAIKTEQHPSAPHNEEHEDSGEATYVVCNESSSGIHISDPVFIFLLSFTCAAGAFLLTWFGILPLMRSKKAPWMAKSLRSRRGTEAGGQQYKMVNADDFDVGDDDEDSDHKLPLTENDANDSSAYLPRSPS